MNKNTFSAAVLGASAAQASEDAVKRAMEAFIGQPVVESVKRTSYGGLYEVVLDNGELIYTDARVSFIIEPLEGRCRLTQEVQIRIGPIGKRLNRAGLAAVERHMREEGENLKALVEADGPAALSGPSSST